MEKPRITIVTPVYNGAEYIEKTIKSVLDQNYPNLEYMIIDGGSTDGTVDIIKKYADRLSYWVSERDEGLYSAIQKGFDRSTGEIMAWINSDDYYGPNCFEIVSEIFSKFPEIDWLTGLCVGYNEKDWMVGASQSRDFTRLDLLCGDCKWIQQESTFWKRSLWNKVGGKFGCYKLADDFELWLRFSRYARLYCVNSYIGGFRQRSKNQLSLEGLDRYNNECKDALLNEPKSKEELKDIRTIKFYRFFERIICKTRIFNANIATRFIRRMYKKRYGNRRIFFDRNLQEYCLQ